MRTIACRGRACPTPRANGPLKDGGGKPPPYSKSGVCATHVHCALDVGVGFALPLGRFLRVESQRLTQRKKAFKIPGWSRMPAAGTNSKRQLFEPRFLC